MEEGQNRGFDKAMATDEDDHTEAELADKAPHRPYRSVLVMPENGKEGVLAVECIDNRCPARPLKSWLRHWSVAASSMSNSTDARWWNLVARQMVDNDQLRKVVRDGQLQEIVLMRTVPSSGGTPSTKELKLSAPLLKSPLLSGVADLVGQWARGKLQPDTNDGADEMTDRDGARQLASLIGSKVEDLDFDDGYVRVKSDAGTTHLSPSRMSEVFTYVITSGDDPPPDVEFYTAVRHRLQLVGVAESNGIDLQQWPV